MAKVIAKTRESGYSDERRWLVEMSEEEIARMAGHTWRLPEPIKIGTEVNVSGVFIVARNALEERKTVSQAINNLRSMADILESIEPTVLAAILPPKDEDEDQEPESQQSK